MCEQWGAPHKGRVCWVGWSLVVVNKRKKEKQRKGHPLIRAPAPHFLGEVWGVKGRIGWDWEAIVGAIPQRFDGAVKNIDCARPRNWPAPASSKHAVSGEIWWRSWWKEKLINFLLEQKLFFNLNTRAWILLIQPLARFWFRVRFITPINASFLVVVTAGITVASWSVHYVVLCFIVSR